MITTTRSWLPAALVAAVFGCSSGEVRSLLPVDIYPGEVRGMQKAKVTVWRGETELASQFFMWRTVSASDPLKVGLYLPESFDGVIQVSAAGLDGMDNELGVSTKVQAMVRAGQTADIVRLNLMSRTGGGGDGGAPQPDGGAPDMGGPVRDVAAPADAGADRSADRPPVDAAPPATEAGPRDTGTPDVPSGLSWRMTENVSGNVLAKAYWPQVAIDPDGNILIIWEEGGIRARRYDAAKAAWEDAKVLEDRGDIYSPVLAMGVGGHAVAAWYQNTSSQPPALQGIWASHTKDGGKIWSPPTRVHMGPVYGDVAIGMSPDGNARLAWEESMMNMNTLWSAHYSATTSSWAGQAPVKAGNDTDDRKPHIAMDKRGGGILTFLQDDMMGDQSTWAAAFSAPSDALTPVLLDTAPMATSTYEPNAAVNPEGGRGVVVWDQGAEIWMAEHITGSNWRPAQKAVMAANSLGAPKVTMDKSSTITMVWTQPLVTGRWNLVASRYVQGQTWSTPAPLETNNQAAGRTDEYPVARIGSDGAGNVIAVWRRKLMMVGETYGAYARRYSGGTWQPEQTLGMKMGLRSWEPELAVSESGRAAAVFYYQDPGNTGDKDAFTVWGSLFR